MKLYSPANICVKCGSADAGSDFSPKSEGDTITRNCLVCGYIWPELPLDTPMDDARREVPPGDGSAVLGHGVSNSYRENLGACASQGCETCQNTIDNTGESPGLTSDSLGFEVTTATEGTVFACLSCGGYHVGEVGVCKAAEERKK